MFLCLGDKVRIMKLRMFACVGWLHWTRVATLLAVAVLVGAGSILVGPIRAAKPVPTPVPYTISDLGSPRYRNWSIYWSRAYGINEPTADVVNIVGGELNRGSTEWKVRASGVLVSRNDLAPDIVITAVNNNGLTVGTVSNGGAFPPISLFANVPGVGIVFLPGSAEYSPAAVNDRGQVVAQKMVSGYPELGQGAMWTIAENGTVAGPIDLGSFRPLDINDWGEMAGLQDSVAAIASFEQNELVVTKLPGLSSGNLGVATALNNSGQVVGYSTDLRIDTGTFRPFLWDPNLGLISLGSLGGTHGKALDINDGGQIVGFSFTASPRNSEQHAFLWERGKMVDLNGQVAVDSKRTMQSADAINDFGHIVGSMYTLSSQTSTLKTFLLTPAR
jgi:probable HAF family extracellular repeat protein